MEILCISASAVAALFGFGSLLRRGKTRRAVITGILLCSVAASLGMSSFRYRIDPYLELPPSPSSTLLMLSALMVFYLSIDVTKLETERQKLRRFPFLLLVPAGVSDILVLGFGFRIGDGGIARTFLPTMLEATALLVAVCCALSIFHVFRHHFPNDMTPLARIVLISSGTAFIALLLGLRGMIVGDARLFAVMDAVIAILVFVGSLLSFRRPDAVERFREETVKRRYERSTLSGLDVEALIAGMSAMVRETALYRRTDCTLEVLAKRMGLTRHQASELLNERMGTNFTAFINGFRVEAAKKLFSSHPEMTVLTVALEVGFGNKTSFNEAFRRAVALTPREFKKKCAENRQDR